MNDTTQQRAILQAGLTDVMLVLYEFAMAPDASLESRRETMNRVQRRVLDLRLRAGACGWNTLHDVCYHAEQNLAVWGNGIFDPTTVSEQLERWVSEVSVHTEQIPDAPLRTDLTAWLNSPIWPIPLAVVVTPHHGDAQHGGGAAQAVVLTALRDELNDLLNELKTCQTVTDAQGIEALRAFANSLQVFGIAAAGAGYLGLMDVCALVRHVLLQDTVATPSIGEWIERLTRWCNAAQVYLQEPTSPRSAAELLALHRDAAWLPRLDQDDQIALTELFQFDTTGASNAPAPVHNTPPSPDAGVGVHDTLEVEIPMQADSEAVIEATDAEPAPFVLTSQAAELVQLVRAEVEQHQSKVNELLTTLGEAARPLSERSAAAATLAEYLNRFMVAVDTVGLIGLKRVFDHVRGNVHSIKDALYSTDLLHALEQLLARVNDYLGDFPAPPTAQALTDYVASSIWPLAMSADDIVALRTALLTPSLITEDENAEQRATQALPEHVSLALPEDVNPRLLDSLLQELPQHTAEFSSAVARMTRGNANKADVDVAQRIAHTLKGSANTVGVTGIAQLTHHIEDILAAFAKHHRIPRGALANVLQNAADVLEAMSEHLLGQGSAPDNALSVLQEILDWANCIDREGIPADDAAAPESVAGMATPTIAASGGEEEPAATLRVPASLIDELLRLVGESIIVTGQLKDRLRLALEENKLVAEQNALFQKLTYELEQIVDVQGVAVSTAGTKFAEFDSLEMDQYNELHTITRRMVEAATDSREMTQGVEDHLFALNELVVQQARVQNESQDAVMRTRMVPAQQLVPRLQRAVRQTCRLTQKNVELEVQGDETLMDSEILNAIVDPLMHVLRNAIDHGIEPEAQRVAAHKPPQGRIHLLFAREGDHVVIRCSDDGAGIDFDAVRATAQARGLIEAGQSVTEAELTKLILRPGFTTRSATTQTSGRGIGLDAVNSRVLELKGSLAINAQRGQGCTLEIRLPLTLISVHALLTNINDQTVAISTRGVEQILHSSVGAIEHDGDTVYYLWNGERMQGARLERMLDLGMNSSAETQLLESRPALVVRIDATDRRVVWIDQVVATQDLVVKQLGSFVPKLPGIEGVTILGSGRVAAVLDLPDLLRAGPGSAAHYVAGTGSAHHVIEKRRVAVVVDDSLSARRALAELMQDLNYEVHAARDGIEAVELLEQHGADIVLADLEMPRMNGLELAAHMRAHPTMKNIPIIMVTSRSTDKHRQQALNVGINVYLNKPFTEDELVRHIEQLITRSQPAGQADSHSPSSSEHGGR